MTKLDVRDLYINIPVKKVYKNTEHLMKTSNTDEQSWEQPTKYYSISNYFQMNVTYYKPKTGVLIHMPISAL